MKTVGTGLDVKTALLVAGASLEARRKHVRPDTKIEVPGFEVGELVLGNSAGLPEMMGFTAVERAEPRRQLLVFRADGEQEVMPTGAWWNPAAVVLPPSRGMLGRVAGGLMEMYAGATKFDVSLRESLKAALGQFRAGRTLCIAGHGVGGALASLAAIDILVNGLVKAERVELYTFGALPCGDDGFAAAFAAAMEGRGAGVSVVNMADVAAATSKDGERAGYLHAGTVLVYSSDTGSAMMNHSLERGYMAGLAGV